MNKEDRNFYLQTASLHCATKGRENIEKWGLQDVDTLLHAMMEELGEIARAHLEKEGDQRLIEEARDLGALCLQLETLLKS